MGRWRKKRIPISNVKLKANWLIDKKMLEASNLNIRGSIREKFNMIDFDPSGGQIFTIQNIFLILSSAKRKNMSTYTQFLYQLVFGSKDHLPFLNEKNQEMLFAYIAGILKNKSCHSYIVGGAINHIHIITHIHPIICPSYLIKDIKEATHSMISRESDLFPRFQGWQVGYGGFTYHISSKRALINYVATQAEHHKKLNFKEELITLLIENGIDYQEEYLFT